MLHHTEYGAHIPAAVHGAPKTAEVGIGLSFFCKSKCRQAETRTKWLSCVQESKEALERLRRMGAFEAQDFDTTVCMTNT